MTFKPIDYNFLVDVNLPKYFKYFNEDNFIFVADLNPKMSDEEVWNYALKNNLVILSKDADFYHRFLTSHSGPKVIYFHLGNHTLQGLHNYFEKNWYRIVENLKTSSLIIAEKNRIQVIK